MGKIAGILLLFLLLISISSLNFTSFVNSSSADSSDNSWATKASMHNARANLGVAAVNGKIYAIGGDTSSVMGNVVPGTSKSYPAVDTNEAYDPATNVWTTKTPMPTARALFAITVCADKIYCIGGYTTNVTGYNGSSGPELQVAYNDTATNEVYDPVMDSWATMAPLPEPMSTLQANYVGNKIYVTAYGSSIVYAYDPSDNSWALKASSPLKVASLASTVIGNKILTIGQSTNYSYYLQAYDSITDSWNILGASNSNGESANGCAVIQTNGSTKIYFFDDPETNIFNVENSTWTTGASMPTNRLCAGVTALNNIIYIIGGRTGPHGYITMMTSSNITEAYLPFDYKTIHRLTLISPQNQSYNESNVTVTFTVDAQVSKLAYSLDGQKNVTIEGNFTLTDLTSGAHSLIVYAGTDDNIYNLSQTANFTIEPVAKFNFPVFVIACLAVAIVISAGLLLIFHKRKNN
jgi:N-acetylneuraminic acid mutarotase